MVEYSEKDILRTAMSLIELQNDELDRLRDCLENITRLNREQLSEVRDASTKSERMEGILKESDESLNEALSLLGGMRQNLASIESAADTAISDFADLGFASDTPDAVEYAPEDKSNAAGKQFVEAHEDYMLSLRNRLSQKD